MSVEFFTDVLTAPLNGERRTLNGAVERLTLNVER
jgi:hypothetical protein